MLSLSAQTTNTIKSVPQIVKNVLKKLDKLTVVLIINQIAWLFFPVLI